MPASSSHDIRPQRPHDLALLDPLLDRTFGPDRQARTVYRLREGVAPVAELCFAAVDRHDQVLASLRFWPIRIAAEPVLQGRGMGRALVAHGLAEARAHGHRICVVVGEPEYYRPFGFVNAPSRGLKLPGPVDPRRFQVAGRAGAGGVRRPGRPGGPHRPRRGGIRNSGAGVCFLVAEPTPPPDHP
jgi:predicted N-acetyltransferase YhbS